MDESILKELTTGLILAWPRLNWQEEVLIVSEHPGKENPIQDALESAGFLNVTTKAFTDFKQQEALANQVIVYPQDPLDFITDFHVYKSKANWSILTLLPTTILNEAFFQSAQRVSWSLEWVCCPAGNIVHPVSWFMWTRYYVGLPSITLLSNPH